MADTLQIVSDGGDEAHSSAPTLAAATPQTALPAAAAAGCEGAPAPAADAQPERLATQVPKQVGTSPQGSYSMEGFASLTGIRKGAFAFTGGMGSVLWPSMRHGHACDS